MNYSTFSSKLVFSFQVQSCFVLFHSYVRWFSIVHFISTNVVWCLPHWWFSCIFIVLYWQWNVHTDHWNITRYSYSPAVAIKLGPVHWATLLLIFMFVLRHVLTELSRLGFSLSCSSPQLPRCWHHKHGSPHTAEIIYLKKKKKKSWFKLCYFTMFFLSWWSLPDLVLTLFGLVLILVLVSLFCLTLFGGTGD